MNSVNGTDRASRAGYVAPADADALPNAQTQRLQEPDVKRQGSLPAQRTNRWNPFRGQLLVGAAMIAIAATTLPLMTGCSLADTPEPPAVEQVEQPASATQSTTVQGRFVQAPVPGGGEEAGIWLVPLTNPGHFTIDGQRYDRIYVGVAGTDATRGLEPGGFGDLTGRVVTKGDVTVLDGVDSIVRGLPRDMQGAVRLGAAPGAEGGADATDLFLVLDAPIWMNGARVEVVHLGAADAPAMAGIQVGDQVTLGGRVDMGAHGAELASITSLSAEHYGGSVILPPTFDGVTFHAAGRPDAELPAIDLGRDGARREVVVVDVELGVAHAGTVTSRAGSERLDATYQVQAFLHGGPTFDVDRGRVVDGDGYKLAPKLTWVEHGENGDTHRGWYLHESSQTLYQLSFTLDADGHADPARASHAIDLSR